MPPTNKEPPHTPTAEEIEREIAQRPGLQEVKVDSVVAGNVGAHQRPGNAHRWLR
ncbi:MAG: hypothetical protein IPO60_14635 [Flavobacteriales bacterium]|nr:hypothetical protein [Flavobacteriales bacterium]